ncbi:MAG: pentapeptide repeat-containing protein, partial [Candidatus Poribacteria bacterium]
KIGSASFRNASLREAMIGDADPSLEHPFDPPTTFQDADLEGAVFRVVDLNGVVFHRANLTNAYLYEAHVVGADLREANLEGAKLKRLSLTHNVTPELTAEFASTESLAAASPEPDQLPPSEAD